MKKTEEVLHHGVRVLSVHPVHGPGPFYTMCKKYFRNEKNAPIAGMRNKKANCPGCLKAMKRVEAEVMAYAEAQKKVPLGVG